LGAVNIFLQKGKETNHFVFADMTIFDQMRHLEMFLVEEHNHGS